MDTKIQSITEKLYNEGVEKGRKEALDIIEKANAEKKDSLKSAKAEADAMLAAADKNARDTKKHTEAELKLYTNQAMESLKSEIVNLITDKITKVSVYQAFEEKELMQKMILKLVADWHLKEDLVVEVSDVEALTNYFNTHTKKQLDKSIKIEQVSGRATSFTVAPADGSYKVNFGEQDFIDYFKTFLRPQLIKLLF
jgi:V/A-type H+-transporting ATPase subunit E